MDDWWTVIFDVTRMCLEKKRKMKVTAVVLGASGAVGKQLVNELLSMPEYSRVVRMVRSDDGQSQPSNSVTHVVKDMDNLKEEVQAVIAEKVPAEEMVVGFSTLGIGANTGALTIDQHRAVDVELNQGFAQGLKASNRVEHLVFMSAVGASPTSSEWGPGTAGFPRYNRVKGDAEEAVKSVGLSHVSIFRPAMIIGSPHTPKFFETVLPLLSFMTPSALLSIDKKHLARSMALRGKQSSSLGQLEVFTFPEMMELIQQEN